MEEITKYAYRWADGKVARNKIRLVDTEIGKKSFRWEGDGDIPPLYNLDLLSQASEGTRVYIVEGEKDVETLQDIGKLATTAYQSHYAFKDDKYLKYFEGLDVVIIPDNDTTGSNYAKNALNGLYESGYPKSIKILYLKSIWPDIPEKADITDYLEMVVQTDKDIKTLEDAFRRKVWPAIDKIKPTMPEKPKPVFPEMIPLYDLLKKDIPEMRFLVDGILPDQGLVMFSGAPKSGKSFFCLELAMAVISNGYFLGKPVLNDFGHVLYFDLENPERVIQNRSNFYLNDQTGNKLYFVREAYKILDQPNNLIDQIKHYRELDNNIKLIIIDTLGRVCSENLKGKTQYQHESGEIKILADYIHEENLLCVVLNHNTKYEHEDPQKNSVGSVGIAGTTDQNMVMVKHFGSNGVAMNRHLYIQGREVEDKGFEIGWENKRWQIIQELDTDNYSADEEEELLNHPYYLAISDFISEPGNNERTITSSILQPYVQKIRGNGSKDSAKAITRWIQKNSFSLKKYGGICSQIIDQGSTNRKQFKFWQDKSQFNNSQFEESEFLDWDDWINEPEEELAALRRRR